MKQTPQLLLVDGDKDLCLTLGRYLREHGFSVDVKHDGEAGLLQATEGSYDLVILGAALEGFSGIEVLRSIRERGELPVVILCVEHDTIDCIVGLELGADDCIARSCDLRELVARLHSILRRSRHQMAAGLGRDKATAGLHLFPAERTATWGGQPLKLTSAEFNLLEILFNHAGATVQKSDLAMRLLGREIGPYDRGLDMHISNLRKKLGKLADGRSPIQTVHRSGYQLLQK